MSPDRIAGAFLLVPSVLVVAIWWIFLFYPDYPPLSKVIEMFLFSLGTDNPEYIWFRSLALLPISCLLLAAAYFLGVARGRVGAITLLVISTAVATSAAVFIAWPFALFLALPIIVGYKCVR